MEMKNWETTSKPISLGPGSTRGGCFTRTLWSLRTLSSQLWLRSAIQQNDGLRLSTRGLISLSAATKARESMRYDF